MANLEVLALDPSVPQIRAPGAGDGYSVPRNMTMAAGTTLSASTLISSEQATIDGVAVGQGGGNIATNTAFGVSALNGNTTGARNVAVGSQALQVSNSNDNTAVGERAARLLTSGFSNTAIGASTLLSTTTASQTVAVGMAALANLSSGSNNTAVGVSAALSTNTGQQNVAIGGFSLLSNTSGSNNVVIGYSAGDAITTGAGNTIVGHNAESGSATANNRIVLGRSVTGTANDRITIGSGTNIAELDLDGVDTTWAASSDARLKENVQESLVGLGLINDLRVVNFQWKRKRDVDSALPQHEDSDERVHGEGDNTYLGFIAQEAQAALKAHNADIVRLVRGREDGILTTAPAALVPVLVKAIQELAARVEKLEGKAQV